MASSPHTTSYVSYQQHVIQSLHNKETHFTKHNIEKALGNVGHKDIEVAEKWLQSHRLDTTLDTESEREFILFLCPTGPFLSEVSKFYEESYSRCGSNSAHNLFPHVTLSSFFKVSDSALPYVLDILANCIENTTAQKPDRIRLSLQSCEGFIGIFLSEESSIWLQEILDEFVRRTDADLGVRVKPQTTQFHLTLAYNFDLSKTDDLSSLAKNIKLDAPVRWELNLYSRNIKFNGKQFQVVLHNYKAKKFDELDLIQHHYVIMDSESTNHKSWKKGRDFDTGKIGLFPENFTKKTAEWRLWTKNFSIPITHSKDRRHGNDNEKQNNKARRSHSMNLKRDKKDTNRASARSTGHRTLERSDSTRNQTQTWEPVVLASTAINPNVAGFVRQRSLDSLKSGNAAHEHKEKSTELIASHAASPSRSEMKEAHVVDTSTRNRRDSDKRASKRNERENTARLLKHVSNSATVQRPVGEIRRLFFIRHAERVDLTFGHDWFQVYIDDKGYHRRNLNLPRRIPTRRGGPKDFFMDGPISEIGTFQAKLIGEALRAKGVTFTQVFCSPSLRCIQTASSVLEGLMDTRLKIKVEPALFEWMAWCRNTLPKFMTVEELADYGFNVDRTYHQFYSLAQFNLYEKTDEYYYRTHSFVENVLRTATGNVLMFGHSATLDVGTRQLTGSPIRKTDDLVRVVQKVPFCGVCVAEESPQTHKWHLAQPPIPSLAHGQNSTFDWRILETTVNGPPYGKGK
uniref:SH3 domain-containing protein n=1 Tax=Clytia hemisphaerica TaxID=252671 RepID=A0A7M6DRC6_9CNID|eukprot:TCONS_00034049-protein